MDRYSRHYLLEEIGKDGQKKLGAARVLVVGMGGLGSPAALYLAAAGIGTIGIADADLVDLTNLQRQVLYRTKDEGRCKVEVAREALLELNPGISVDVHDTFIDGGNAGSIVRGYDIVLCAIDSFQGRLELNDACVDAAIPCIHAGVSGLEGQVMTYIPGSSCYRCVFPFATGDSQSGSSSSPLFGTLGPAAGIAGTMQAAEAIKYFCGFGRMLQDRLLVFDLATASFTTLDVRRNASCRSCSTT